MHDKIFQIMNVPTDKFQICTNVKGKNIVYKFNYSKFLGYFIMFLSILFINSIVYAACVDVEAYNLQVKYLEDLVNTEVEKSRNYKSRTDNRDLLGDAENSKNIYSEDTLI